MTNSSNAHDPTTLFTIKVENTKAQRHLFEQAIEGDEAALDCIRATVLAVITPENLREACRPILGD